MGPRAPARRPRLAALHRRPLLPSGARRVVWSVRQEGGRGTYSCYRMCLGWSPGSGAEVALRCRPATLTTENTSPACRAQSEQPRLWCLELEDGAAATPGAWPAACPMSRGRGGGPGSGLADLIGFQALRGPETPWDPAGNSSWEQEARVGSCSVTAEVGAFPGEGKPPCPWPSHGKGSGRFFPPRTGSGLGFGGRQARTRDCESEDLGPPEGSLLGCHSSGGSTPLRACVLACETGD